MKNKIILSVLCMIVLIGVSGCGSNNKEYYCDSEEHELRGASCVIKEKVNASFEYYCSGSGFSTLKGNRCYSSIGMSIEANRRYYCNQGTLTDGGIMCEIEKTYNAKER